MSRHLLLLLTALALAAPVPARAQSTSDDRAEAERERVEEDRERARERAQEIREREQERAQDARERALERAQEARERAQEQAEEARERARDRAEQMREAAGKLDTTVTFDPRGTVNVECPGGDIQVTGSDRNQIVVHAENESGGIRFTSSGSNATLEAASSRGCSDARFVLSVPAGVHLVARSWSGSLAIRGVHGDVEAHSQSGDVEVRDAGSHLEAESLSGNVTVQGVRGDAMVHSLSGDVILTGARGNAEVETVSGDIELRDVVARQVRTNTTSGDVTFAGAILDDGRYEFSTHSGELRLELPANVGAQLSLSTFSGEIDTAFPITIKAGQHDIGVSTSKKLNFSLGSGSARIIAETFSGDVTLTSAGARK
jgi:DUF4097 and DUF4098 domain-containing protein YvlB